MTNIESETTIPITESAVNKGSGVRETGKSDQNTFVPPRLLDGVGEDHPQPACSIEELTDLNKVDKSRIRYLVHPVTNERTAVIIKYPPQSSSHKK